MRGANEGQAAVFSYVPLEARIPSDHPLRRVRSMVDGALRELHGEFSQLYSHTGRPSIPPEQLLRASLLQILYSVRSERMLMEQMDYNLLFRWFVGLEMDDAVWDASTFSKNRERFLAGDVSRQFLARIVEHARQAALLSDEHFSVDGTLIEAWASMKSVRPRDGGSPPSSGGGRNTAVDFRGEKRTNETHASTTDPEARLYRKGDGKETKLCYLGHVLMENRNGLIVDACVTQATGTAERDAAARMIAEIPGSHRITMGADKGFDTQGFIEKMRELRVTPHVAQNISGRRSAIDGRTTRHDGYTLSQRFRKRIEESFGWSKTTGGIRKMRHKGRRRVDWMFVLTQAAYNLVRMRRLLEPAIV